MHVTQHPKFTNATSYMDGKLKEHFGEKCVVKNITFKQCEEFIEKTTQVHSKEELFLLEDSLDIEVDMNKQTGLKQTFLSIWSSVLLGIVVALVTMLNSNVQSLITFMGKTFVDSNANKEQAIKELSKLINDSYKMSLNQVVTPVFYMVFLGITGTCVFIIWRHNKMLQKSLFHHKIIKRCIDLKERRNLEEEKKDKNYIQDIVSA
ncbi:hypothetical protein LKM00_24685 [Bacillus wiedmannii]|uniref:hypothetical protein n=1 Tax=Bacillus wiedmannii TaxID=1890302 RepID=UPI0002DBED9E|nr:hypothetical protein [Bacillus wiedmannii]MCC2380593.1 hypothetical protein [Bacillus wiedmannii]MCC2424691.1 hypothetical protein [Bacillus wiedmannii]